MVRGRSHLNYDEQTPRHQRDIDRKIAFCESRWSKKLTDCIPQDMVPFRFVDGRLAKPERRESDPRN